MSIGEADDANNTLKIINCDYISNGSQIWGNYPAHSVGHTVISNCFIAYNNASSIICTSTVSNQDSNTPSQYYGLSQPIKAPRVVTPNFP